jgi:predicted GH43/DUF377 family glycosyl hydrolase
MRLLVATVLLALSASTSRAQEPWLFTRWDASAKNPLFAGTGADTWDKKIRERGYILIDEKGTYHLWYTGYNDDKSPLRLLGHATSKDGLAWERDPKNPIHTEGWVEDMCIVKKDGTFHMFAEGKGDVAHRLTSTDGISWKEQGPLDVRLKDGKPIEPGPYGTPAVIEEDGTWFLFYERKDLGIWLATSKDLKVWTNVQDEPIIALGPEKYDKAAVAMNQVVKKGDTYYAIYHANESRPGKPWTTCLARSKDKIHWEKFPANPIIPTNNSSGILVQTPEGLRLYTMHPDVRVYLPGTPQR